MKIVITAALPMEIAGIRRLGNFTRAALTGGLEYYRGDVQGKDAALFVSGMGEKRAYETAKAACAALQPKAYICMGLSAALKERLRPGDIVVGESVVPPEGGDAYNADAGLLSAARAALKDTALFAPVTASRRVAWRSTDKRLIAANCPAAALDMETLGAARACAEAGVPFLAVRAISDSLHEDLPVDFNRYMKDGGMDWPRFLSHIVTHPGIIPPLMRLGRQSRLAAGNITQAAGKLLSFKTLPRSSCRAFSS